MHSVTNDVVQGLLNHNLISIDLHGNMTLQDKCGQTAIFCDAPTVSQSILSKPTRAGLAATNYASQELNNPKIIFVGHDGFPANYAQAWQEFRHMLQRGFELADDNDKNNMPILEYLIVYSCLGG
jgi:hypothetical protein